MTSRDFVEEAGCKRAYALDPAPRAAGGRAVPGDLGPVSAPNGGGPCGAGGPFPAHTQNPLKNTFFSKTEKARPCEEGLFKANAVN